MSGRRRPGPAGTTRHGHVGDGTLCLQPSQIPGIVGHKAHEVWAGIEHEAERLSHKAAESPAAHRMRMLTHDLFDWIEVHEPGLARELNLSPGYDPAEPEWLRIARREVGEKRAPGFGTNNPRILQYLAAFRDDLKTAADVDETPWCACFVNWCLEKAGMPKGPSARAKDWMNYGTALDKPRLGAITIVHHTPGKSTHGTTSSGNHVAFYVSRGDSSITLLGGNQTHSVCQKTFSGWEILGYRWPEIPKPGAPGSR